MSILSPNRVQSSLKPQDVLVLLKILSKGDKQWRLSDLGFELGLSQSEVSLALERARRSQLLDDSKKKIVRASFEEFLIHGLKYVFPGEFGLMARGIPTSHSAAPLKGRIVSNADDQYVWAHPEGSVRGQSVSPLCEWAPGAALKDPVLHELLALVDAIRIGRARERNLAAEEIRKRLA